MQKRPISLRECHMSPRRAAVIVVLNQ